MITISSFIENAKENLAEAIEVLYIYPTLYVVCTLAIFENKTSEHKDNIFCDELKISIEDLNKLRGLGIFEIILCTLAERQNEYQFLNITDGGHHWLEWFNPLLWKDRTMPLPSHVDKGQVAGAKVLHFYGYKGGQARSTVLLLLAKLLADNGQRVLLVDADVEAPSLDAMLELATEQPEATLMGLCGWANSISPISRAYVGRSSSGTVDLLACRPRTPEYDMDFAAFVLGTALDARTLERGINKLRTFVNEADGEPRYDLVMFDHRTGVTPSILPIIQSWPGPTVIFVRPDGMAKPAEMHGVFRTLLSQDSETPGAFVSFSLDPEDAHDGVRSKNGKFIEQLLTTVSDALTRGGIEDDIDPSELEDYWVLWHHDRALLNGNRVIPMDLSVANQRSLQHLTDLLNLKKVETVFAPNHNELMISGATDGGWFILTPDIARLFSPESSIRYIFGRKGTGKTRLLRELQNKRLGEPLLVASDYEMGGLPSAGTAFLQLYMACEKNADSFWWTLLRIALECQNTYETALTDRINAVLKAPSKLNSTESIQRVEELLNSAQGQRTFLIDGVETGVPAAELRGFVEALFRFMAAIQYNRTISNKLKVRLFLRSDLWQGASQNVEQQVEGSNIVLRWDQTSVFNFAIARMVSLPWFQSQFPVVCSSVLSQKELIERGALSNEKAEALLLNVFPTSLNRNKLKTTTFFSTYFSDAGGDSESKASFYPRLFDAFLRGINDLASAEGSTYGLKDGRLSSTLVLTAYDEASGTFINEVRHELYTLLPLNDDAVTNKQTVDFFIENFSGQKTPFEPTELVTSLAQASRIEAEKVREGLNRMKAMGIFENSPGSSSVWRTGRLYKSGLKMKYVRSGADKR
jgi:CobQ/CobB/MinD/ParA nucleotide binding domain